MNVRTSLLALASASLLFLPGCGGGGSPTQGTPPTTQPACSQTVLKQDSGAVATSTVAVEDVTASASGRLDVTLDWTFPTSRIGLYVVQGGCTLAQFNTRSCNFLVQSEPGGAAGSPPTAPKPRKVSATVAAGAYSVLVANFSKVTESLSFQAVLSSSTCPAATNVVNVQSLEDSAPEQVDSIGR